MSSGRPSYFERIQVPPREFVAAALAYGRQLGKSQRVFPAVLDEGEVNRRYLALRSQVLELAGRDGELRDRLLNLEEGAQVVGHSAWVPLVLAARADESKEALRLARELWDALGIHQHDAVLLERPHTYRGFIEGRGWLLMVTFSVVVALIAGSGSWLGLTWEWIAILAIWLGVLLVLFRCRISALIGKPRAELSHF